LCHGFKGGPQKLLIAGFRVPVEAHLLNPADQAVCEGAAKLYLGLRVSINFPRRWRGRYDGGWHGG
jgi:hypothetical protein